MTTILQIAFSDEIKGIGIEAGAPFMSVPSPYKDGDSDRKFDLGSLLSLLQHPKYDTIEELADFGLHMVQQQVDFSQIEDPQNLKNKPVFVGINTEDDVIDPKFEIAAALFFEKLGANVDS